MSIKNIAGRFKEKISTNPKYLIIIGVALLIILSVIITLVILNPFQDTPDSSSDSSGTSGISDSIGDSSGEFSESDNSSDESENSSDSSVSGGTSSQDDSSIGSSSGETSSQVQSTPTNGATNPPTPTLSGTPNLKELSQIWINVRNFGAKGDGVTDDAPAIEAAIASIKEKGGTVYLPSGNYKMSKGILVPIGVSIVGVKPSTTSKWRNITSGSTPGSAESAGNSWISSSNFRGTWIMPDHGRGNVNSAPTFRLQGNTTVENLGFVYPGQAPVTSNVTQYPPAIAVITTPQFRFTRDGVRIANINLLNPYVGIAIMQGQDFNNYHVGSSDTQNGLISTGRMTVHDITGSPLWKGIYIKGILDTIDIQRAGFGLSNFNREFAQFRHDNCVDIEVARADGINISDSFSLGASYGVKTTTAYSGASSIRANNLTIKGRIPVSLVTGLYKFNDVELTMVNYGSFSTSDTFRGMEVFQDNRCVHQPFYLFSNMTVVNSIKSTSLSDISMHIKLGKSGNVSVTNSRFVDANPDTSEPVILFEKNDGSSISAMFNNTVFQNSASSGLLARVVSINNGSLQFNNCTIADNLYGAMPSGNNVWFADSKLTSGTVLNIN